MESFLNKIHEEITSIWKLLNDTTIFLNRIKKADLYEQDLRDWRINIQKYRSNPEKIKEIKKNLIEFRKTLRLQGFNLQLGSKDIEIFGFKSDDAPLEGYKRLTIAYTGNEIYYIKGEENHQELTRLLAFRLRVESIFIFKEVHHLWFRWRDNVLQIFGADSESKDDLERFKKYVDENKSILLKKLKNI